MGKKWKASSNESTYSGWGGGGGGGGGGVGEREITTLLLYNNYTWAWIESGALLSPKGVNEIDFQGVTPCWILAASSV